MNTKKVSVLGFGSWGIALALHLYKNGHTVTAWQRSKEKCDAMIASGVSELYLPGVAIPKDITLTSEMERTAGADIVIFAAGSKATRELAELYKPYWRSGQILVSASKGLEPGTNLRLSEVLLDVLPGARAAAISGPCHAEELSRGIISAYVAASQEPGVADIIQDVFMSREFRIYTNPDIIGVELGGAFKQCIAISVGISDGLGYGDNARAALITRGIVEMSRLGVAMGAKLETFSGLTGIGDLVGTCTSTHSRNRRAGVLLGQGKTLDETLKEIGMLVEGVNTAEPTLAFADKYGVPMPITTEVSKVLFEGKDPKLVVQSLMERDRTSERVLYDSY
jgi:glycerol-3-phosphate dehydrogenase (NAD(P)+)